MIAWTRYSDNKIIESIEVSIFEWMFCGRFVNVLKRLLKDIFGCWLMFKLTMFDFIGFLYQSS